MAPGAGQRVRSISVKIITPRAVVRQSPAALFAAHRFVWSGGAEESEILCVRGVHKLEDKLLYVLDTERACEIAETDLVSANE